MLDVKKFMLPAAAGQKIWDGGGGTFYYLFLYHNVSCNITKQLIKTN